MNKQEAIAWFKEVQGGDGVDRITPLNVVRRGRMAVTMWNDPEFTLGMEYGVLIALTKAFGWSTGCS
jgi:hypothetical protein